MSKRLIIIIIVALISAASLYLVLNQLMGASNLEILDVDFKLSLENYRLCRSIELLVKNKGDANLTISSVRIDGKDVHLWILRGGYIPPRSTATILVFYPWKSGGKYSIEIVSDSGSAKVEEAAPSLDKIGFIVNNRRTIDWHGILSFEVEFSDGECKPYCLEIVDENGVKATSQMWGILTYDSGYVRYAVISFIAHIPKESSKTYYLVPVDKEVRGVSDKINVFENSDSILVSNGELTVKFNLTDRFHGSIDYFGSQNKGINFAEIFKPPQATLSELYFFHGFLDSVFDSNGKMFAIIMKTDVTVESKGPLFAVVKRTWKLRDLGMAYDFYAIPENGTYILYNFLVDIEKPMGLGALAGEGEYTIYNPAGMGSFAIAHLAVKNATFFLTLGGEIYAPLYPGMDIYADQPMAACIDHETGVFIQLLANDPQNPVGYWHISKQKFPWHIWGGDKPNPSTSEIGGYEYAKDLIFIAGVHKYMLCYSGQQSDPWRSGGLVIQPGTYSWLFEVYAAIKEDVLTAMKREYNMYYSNLEIEVKV
ncbi:MAG: hypothetical protein DRJ32_01965 [Thermoprotei archaeon]|nr:MAG: hypothetical protein DRJ32_01965 [Thermoprotei archaeon]